MKTVTTKWLLKRSEAIEPQFPDRCIVSGDAVAGTVKLKQSNVILNVPYNEDYFPKVKDYREKLDSNGTTVMIIAIRLLYLCLFAFAGYAISIELLDLQLEWTAIIVLIAGGLGFQQGAPILIRDRIESMAKKSGIPARYEDGPWLHLAPGLLEFSTQATADGHLILKLKFKDDQFADDFLALQPKETVVETTPETS